MDGGERRLAAAGVELEEHLDASVLGGGQGEWTPGDPQPLTYPRTGFDR